MPKSLIFTVAHSPRCAIRHRDTFLKEILLPLPCGHTKIYVEVAPPSLTTWENWVKLVVFLSVAQPIPGCPDIGRGNATTHSAREKGTSRSILGHPGSIRSADSRGSGARGIERIRRRNSQRISNFRQRHTAQPIPQAVRCRTMRDGTGALEKCPILSHFVPLVQRKAGRQNRQTRSHPVPTGLRLKTVLAGLDQSDWRGAGLLRLRLKADFVANSLG